MATPDATYTLADVTIDVKRQFGDESGVQITDADIVRWANRAQKEIVNKNPIIQASANQDAVPGQQTYVLPVGLRQLESVMYDGNILQPSSFEGIRSTLGVDNNVQGVPLYWYQWANAIYLWPIPSDNTDPPKQVTINYSAMPKVLTTVSDTLGVPDQYYDRVVEFVMAQAYELDEDWQGYGVQSQKFEDKLMEATNSEKNQIGSFPVASDAEYEDY